MSATTMPASPGPFILFLHNAGAKNPHGFLIKIKFLRLRIYFIKFLTRKTPINFIFNTSSTVN